MGNTEIVECNVPGKSQSINSGVSTVNKKLKNYINLKHIRKHYWNSRKQQLR